MCVCARENARCVLAVFFALFCEEKKIRCTYVYGIYIHVN